MTHSASAPALRCIVTAGDHLNTQFIPFIADISSIQFYRNVIFVSYALSLAISAIYNCTVSQTNAGTRHKQCVGHGSEASLVIVTRDMGMEWGQQYFVVVVTTIGHGPF